MTEDNQQRTIEYMPLAELLTRLHPQNAKDHDISAIVNSYKAHGYVASGYVASGVLDDRTGLFLAGHGRVMALDAMKRNGAKAPDGIRNGGDDWLVPVQTGYHSDNDTQALAYLAADNKLTIAGGWNEVALAELLQEVANSDEVELSASGFDGDELDEILRDLGQLGEPPEDPGAQVDKAAELNKKWQVKRGDVWQVGKHRIMCGDSTSAEDVEVLMGGAKAQMCFTDPPYGVGYTGGAKKREKLKNDDIGTDIYNRALPNLKFALDDEAALYLWYADAHVAAAAAAAAAAGYHIAAQIIWVKNHAQFVSSAKYHGKHEPCFYAYKKGKSARWNGDNNEVTVWEYDRSQRNDYHPTQKPVVLAQRAINNSSYRNNIILDLFLGGGTTLVACEQTGRIGYGMEIAPDYVAVCLERLTGMGLEARLVENKNPVSGAVGDDND
jgi:DNA modification methylase